MVKEAKKHVTECIVVGLFIHNYIPVHIYVYRYIFIIQNYMYFIVIYMYT